MLAGSHPAAGRGGSRSGRSLLAHPFMLNHVINAGAYNATFWLVLLAAGAVGRGRGARAARPVRSAVVVLFALGTAGNLFLALYRGYAVPRDVMQDIVSAEEYLAGRPPFPPDMTERIGAALDRDGPRGTLFERWPSLREREVRQIEEMRASHWVQAHPPFMTLFTAPFVAAFGVVGTQAAFAVIGLVSLALTLALIRRELFPHIDGRMAALVGLAVLGWDPVLTALRRGRPGCCSAGC